MINQRGHSGLGVGLMFSSPIHLWSLQTVSDFRLLGRVNPVVYLTSLCPGSLLTILIFSGKLYTDFLRLLCSY